MLMLRESSISTETMFCCGRNVAMLIAGCHSRNSIRAASSVSSSQIATGRAPVRKPRRRCTCHPRPIAIATIASPRVQAGHAESSTNWPFENTVAGYLKRNSNISSVYGAGVSARAVFPSVCHGVDDVVYPCSKRLGRELLRIVRTVGPFPGVAIILIEAHRHHDTSAIVVDAAPVRVHPVVLIGLVKWIVDDPRHLHALIEVVEHVKDGIAAFT